jgi:hypothetical protein
LGPSKTGATWRELVLLVPMKIKSHILHDRRLITLANLIKKSPLWHNKINELPCVEGFLINITEINNRKTSSYVNKTAIHHVSIPKAQYRKLRGTLNE